MDNLTISRLILQRCPKLAHLFVGCFSSDNFPKIYYANQFLIANTATSNDIGEHWILIARTVTSVIYFDSLNPSRISDNFMSRLTSQYMTTKLSPTFSRMPVRLLRPKDLGIQPQSNYTTTCALYCIYVAHIIFSNRIKMFSFAIRSKQQQQQLKLKSTRQYITEDDIVRFCNEHYNLRLYKNVLFL